MKLGIVANITRENIGSIVANIADMITAAGFKVSVHEQLRGKMNADTEYIFCDEKTLGTTSDLLVSIGGDGTMLSAALIGHTHDKPLVGINFGKLGFLADVDVNKLTDFLSELQRGEYRIEERMVLESSCNQAPGELHVAFNDFVIDKGYWPKMIDIRLVVDDEYVTTFPADGVVFATPTGSTGYSLSVGGPIVTQKAEVITISPISPHSLTARPLVLSPYQTVKITAFSQHKTIQFNADGQRVVDYISPAEICISRCRKSLKILRTHSSSYFEVLRNKLFWGLDVRNSQIKL
ncbi:MAG: NAD kinase [Ignavibacteriaceae bacterium]|nr:NAD kinase [Ignavibacteriaceae bacterium]MCK6615809.1 NAD(+)/NADH kinase [Ignavibacteriaceae bacterium]